MSPTETNTPPANGLSGEQLGQQPGFLRAVFKTVIDGIVIIDIRGTIKILNPAMEQIFGYREAEMLGRNVKMLMPEPFRGEHDGYISNYLATGEAAVIGIGREVVGRRKDGSLFPMDLAVAKMQTVDECFFVGAVRDISERKRVERLKDEFVSTISHELRTPLTSIRGAIEVILEDQADDLPPDVLQMLSIASRNGLRLTNLIDDLLNINKLESEQSALKLDKVDLVQLLEEAVAANQGYALHHDVSLRALPGPASALVLADGERMLQVLANLISNAIKYAPENTEVHLSLRLDEGSARVGVKDRGRGIPEEFKEAVFDRFVQADGSDTRSHGGTGLGLPIARTILEQHGGTLDFRPVESGGTEFFFKIPLYQTTDGQELAV